MSETACIGDGGRRSRLRLLAAIRFREVLPLQGSPLVGACFAVGGLSSAHMLAAIGLALGSICLVAHVFLLNDWSGIGGDLRDVNRVGQAFTTKGVSAGEVAFLAAAMLAISLVIFGMLGPVTFSLALAIAALSALYSAPAIHLKGSPMLNSVLHLLGGALHFLLGYATFRAIDERAVAISCVFALVFTAGHLTHEARDHDSDSLNDIRTNAVAFGRRRSFLASLALFGAAYLLLAALGASGMLPRVLVLAPTLFIVHLAASIRALRTGLSFETLRVVQRCYHLIFAFIGVVLVVTSHAW